MKTTAEEDGPQLAHEHDDRLTEVGKFLRLHHLDELPQLFNVLKGEMSFVGTRPEVPKYVNQYSNEMLATLLLPAGVTSEASILYKDEDELLDSAVDTDKVYVEAVLPAKMYYNLKEITREGMFHDIKVMFMTFFAVCGKKYKG